jgi:sn-glycerol 3-phosphate transport system ATP-binding protein
MTDIVLKELTKTWGTTTVVDRISFRVKDGTFAVLLGPSGCGKSTTLRMLAGLDEPTSGNILIGERDVTHTSPAQRKLSMVFQSYALFPHLNVRENILFGLKVRKEPAGDYDRRLHRVVDMLSLTGLLDRKPGQLSGGQQQRVALARAMIAETPLCLMDEPLSNLDAKLRQEMRRDIRDLQRKLGITMVYVTHDQTEAMSMADQVILMRAGRIEQDGTPEDLYNRPATTFAATFIGTPPTNLFPAVDGQCLGVRPEHVHQVDSDGVLGAVVSNEYLGSDTLVACVVKGLGHADGSPWRLVAKLPGRQEPAPGTAIRLGWQAQHEHRFDSNTGARL